MRVALVIERFGRAGGVENVALAQARALQRRGVAPAVVCRDADERLAREFELVRVWAPTFWQPLRLYMFSAGARGQTRGAFDVVHSLSRTRHQNIYRAGGGSHAAYLENVFANPQRRARFSPRHRMILDIEEAVFRDARQIIQCNSKMVAGDLAQRYQIAPERLSVIYNGVDIERFHPLRRATEGAAARRELKLEGPIALFCGSGFERKGLDRAILGLANSRADATLLVAGRGDAGRFQQIAATYGVSDQVRFLGHRDDLAALYTAADLLVLPTRYDPFANVCLEAMASGLPVATTPTNGASELIDPGVNGWIGRDDFSPAFALLGDSQKLKEMGRAARQTAEGFSWDHYVDQILRLYRRVAA